jgi:sodium/proline symporter
VLTGGFKGISENLSNFPRFTDIFGIATPLDETGAAAGVQAVINGKPAFGPGADYSFLSIVSCMAWGLGYFGMPQVLLRFMAIKKTSKIRESRMVAVTWCFISLFAAVAIGMIGRAYLPTLLNTASGAENIFLHLSVNFFPPLLAGIVLSGILAASMSSSDSYMLIASSAFANDLYKGIVNKKASETSVMWVARIAMLLVTIFGAALARLENQSIFRLVSYAWAGFGAAFGPLILFSLFWKRTTLQGAIAGMLTGGIVVVVWKNILSKRGGIFTLYELLPAFIFSCLAIIVVSLITRQPSQAIEREFDAAKVAEY